MTHYAWQTTWPTWHMTQHVSGYKPSKSNSPHTQEGLCTIDARRRRRRRTSPSHCQLCLRHPHSLHIFRHTAGKHTERTPHSHTSPSYRNSHILLPIAELALLSHPRPQNTGAATEHHEQDRPCGSSVFPPITLTPAGRKLRDISSFTYSGRPKTSPPP